MADSLTTFLEQVPAQFRPIMKELASVLDPLGEEAKTRLAFLALGEFKTHGIISFCENKDGVTWKLGQPSPQDDNCMVFAMFLMGAQVWIYTQAKVKDESGRTGTLYFREICFEPANVYGPISKEALENELEQWLEEDDEDDPDGPPKGKTNGAAAAAAED